MDTVRMGIIGCGGISRGHAKRLRAIPGVELIALVEPSEQMVKQFGEAAFPGEQLPTVYTDYKPLLEKEQLDAVLIASPHTCHYEQITAALDAGLHVLAEKPMVCTAEEAQGVIDKCNATGRHIVVSYQRRFQKLFRYMKGFVHSEAFGQVLCLSAFQAQAWLTGQTGKWRQDPALSGGGQLNDSGSHLVDIILWMLDEPVVEVSAMIDNRARDVDIDSAINFRTRSGALGSVAIVGSATHKGMQEDIVINGANGGSLYKRQGGLEAVNGFGEMLAPVTEFGDCEDSNPDAHFIDVLRGKATNESPPESFLNVIRFTEASWKSAAEGGARISIPETVAATV